MLVEGTEKAIVQSGRVLANTVLTMAVSTVHISEQALAISERGNIMLSLHSTNPLDQTTIDPRQEILDLIADELPMLDRKGDNSGYPEGYDDDPYNSYYYAHWNA